MLVEWGDGLEVADLLADASAATGLDDFGDEWFRTPLELWSRDLRGDHLSDTGRRLFRSQAVRDLSRRLRVLDTLRRTPEIGEVEIPPIVHITGLERSGTTLLHNLVASHRSARALLRWELMEPVPPPDSSSAATDPRIAAVQSAVDRLRGSLLERMHWVNADEPEECVWGFIDCVSFLGQAAAYCMPRWGEFMTADHSRVFEHYRQVVQLLTWKHPVPDGGFLALKAPQVAFHLADFARVFPEARFVIPDRDPYRCVVSTEVMVRSIVEPLIVDPSQSGFDPVDAASRKLDAITSFELAEPDRVVHLRYPSLIDDPIGTVEGVFDALAISQDPFLEQSIGAFLGAQRAGKRAAPPPELDPFGLDHVEFLARPAIADYCRRNGIEPEVVRLTG